VRRPHLAALAAAAGVCAAGACAAPGAEPRAELAAAAAPVAPVAPVAPAAPPPASVACAPREDDARTCTFTLPGGRLRAVDSLGQLAALAVWHADAWRPLPRFPGREHTWGICGLPLDDAGVPMADHVGLGDVDADGRADVTVVAECATGRGSEGGRPVPVGAVYTQRAPGRFTADAARGRALTAALPETCATGPCDLPAAGSSGR
jgi:hypothetical protein